MIVRPASRTLPALALMLALSACGGTTFDPGASQIEQPPQPTTAPPVATLGGQTYTVVAGDTIDSVAREYGVPVDVLIQANNLASPYQLHAGQQLVIPVSGSYVVQAGDSLYRIALKHSTTVAAIAQINNIAPPYRIKVGQHLTLPGTAVAQSGLSGTTIGDTMPPLTPAPSLPPAGSSLVTTESLAPPSGVSAAPAPASSATPGSSTVGTTAGSAVVTSATLPNLAPVSPAAPPSTSVTSTAVTTAQTGTMASGFTGGAQVKPVAPGAAGAIPIIPPVSTKGGTSTSAPNPSESVSQSVTNSASQVTNGSAAASSAAGSQTASAQPGATTAQPLTHGTGKFLWPVNGKIISPFGPKDGGLHNDGINIAAPLGTPVHAADNGVVVYAGNELRGFGNLLLVRHADGWVSAYAHCDALLVKRGDNVKRGQVIARVGQSGNVSAPQLHFELRKGAEAVDPLGQLGPQGA
jgi:murein DD-endopeptidase MepM/ murein hydrolase activator NlpD